MTVVWPGEPGETFHNTTEKILYQLVCTWVNTCGTCGQYHLAIAKWWPRFHHGCNCISKPIYPDKTSAPYEDFTKIIDGLPEDQKNKVVGKANMQLIDAGVVKWDDVVTSNRVRNLREVVAREKLTVKDMIDAGVKPQTAKQAYETVNTPAHKIAAQQRTDLLKQIQALGIKPQHLKDMFGEAMAQKIGIGGGPSGPSVIPPGKTDKQWVAIIMQGFGGKAEGGRRRAEEKTPPTSLSVEEFAKEAQTAARSVPDEERYSDTRVWIIDAFEEFKKKYPDATLDDFKKSLTKANMARLITLARFDLPGQVSKETRVKDDKSETKQGVATFNQIRLDKP